MHDLFLVALLVLGQSEPGAEPLPATTTTPAAEVAPVSAAAPPPAALAEPPPAPKRPEEPPPLLDSLLVDFEVGAAYLFQNDGRYGSGGTSYTAAEVGQQRNLAVALRLALEARIGRHTVIATWAPLDLTTRATMTRDLTFRDTTFASGSVLDHRYLFDGYRLSYLFGLVQIPRFSLGVGASVQVRNASVEFRTVDTAPAVFAVERDIGVVGAIKLRARFDAGLLYAQADVDFFNTFGLGLPAGIHDVALTMGVPVFKGFDFLLRLRLVGGGANVPSRDIYNWGNFGFAQVGFRADLPELWRQR
jgi:hypothetical protein